MTPKAIVVVLAAVAIFVGGYASGRYVAPEKVVVTEKLVKVEVEKVVVQERTKTEVKVVRVQDERRRLHKEETERKWANGTQERKVVTDENVDKTVREQEIKYVDRQVVVEKEKRVEVAVEKEKLVERKRPDWRAGALVGYSLPVPELGLGVSNLALGLEVERRIAGPISVGAWGLTSGQAGLMLNVEF